MINFCLAALEIAKASFSRLYAKFVVMINGALSRSIEKVEVFQYFEDLKRSVDIGILFGLMLADGNYSGRNPWMSIVRRGPGGRAKKAASTQKGRQSSTVKKKHQQLIRNVVDLDVMQNFEDGYENSPSIISMFAYYTCVTVYRSSGGGNDDPRNIDPRIQLYFGNRPSSLELA
jgi:hypothetical protein